MYSVFNLSLNLSISYTFFKTFCCNLINLFKNFFDENLTKFILHILLLYIIICIYYSLGYFIQTIFSYKTKFRAPCGCPKSRVILFSNLPAFYRINFVAEISELLNENISRLHYYQFILMRFHTNIFFVSSFQDKHSLHPYFHISLLREFKLQKNRFNSFG